jgi:RNA polymerase sigma-70 factor, ECF subfamily
MEQMRTMDMDTGLAQIVNQAILGDKACTERLAEVARQRLFPYIYRLTLDHDLSQDLLQETLLKMVENMKTLEQPDRFWNWLFRTALGSVQHHYRKQARTRTTEFSALDPERFSRYMSARHDDGLTRLMRKELSEAVVDGVAALSLDYRSILILRCYEQMSFSEIAHLMGCKELRARVLFFRAKHALSRRLAKVGFRKSLLLAALALFEVVTAPKEAAAACTVTAASLKVGVTGSVAGFAGTPSGIAVALTATGLTATLTLEQFIYAILFASFALICFVIALVWE